MNLTYQYLTNHGYDYYENAAEDTLVFFVHDAAAPSPENMKSTVSISDNNSSLNENNFIKDSKEQIDNIGK